jgi:hypothetical protein
VQIIESTPYGVRSAVLTVARPDTGVRFVIFPMMHIGSVEYFEQGKALDLRAFGDRVTNVDVSAAEFGQSWRRAPRAWRLLLYGAIPAFVLWMLLAGSRRVLARDAEVEDLPTRDEALMGEEYDRLAAAFLDDRDRKLCAAISELVDSGSASPMTVGILWGAAHIRAVLALLLGRLGYRVVAAEWVTVFLP